jgi:hypothetical protein
VNFTDAALDVLRQHSGAYRAFVYATTHGGPADYRVLKGLPCPADYAAPACGQALLDMRARLGLDADGNPLAAK